MKSLFGLPQNIVAMMAYFSPFAGIILYILERENKFVRFHALQGTIIMITLRILISVLFYLPFVGGLLGSTLALVASIAVIYMIVTTLMGRAVRIPILGDIVWEQVNKK